jgi:hypothetical protein
MQVFHIERAGLTVEILCPVGLAQPAETSSGQESGAPSGWSPVEMRLGDSEGPSEVVAAIGLSGLAQVTGVQLGPYEGGQHAAGDETAGDRQSPTPPTFPQRRRDPSSRRRRSRLRE